MSARLVARVRLWLATGRAVDPVDRAIEPFVRAALAIGVLTSVFMVWVGWFSSDDRATYLAYALRSTPIQLVGLIGSLALLETRGNRPAARFFVGFVIVTLGLTSVMLGAALVSGSAVRLIVPVIVLVMALEEGESALLLLGLIGAIWLGVALPSFTLLAFDERREVIGRLAITSMVMASAAIILGVFRRAFGSFQRQFVVTEFQVNAREARGSDVLCLIEERLHFDHWLRLRDGAIELHFAAVFLQRLNFL